MTEVLTAGTEFSVNTNTAFNQTSPEIAALPDGGYVIVWGTLDTVQDGDNSAIKAQRFDASGNPVGPEFLVNSEALDAQYTADIAAFPDGSFVICWVSNDVAQDGDSCSVKARLFDASGTPVGPEFLVNTQSFSRQDEPHITVLDNGNFVVSWTDWTGFDMKAQIFSPDGQKIGGEFRVNTSLTGTQDSGDIVALEGGGFVVTWRTTNTSSDGSGTAVMARVFDSSGVGGTEFVVNSAKVGDQYMANVTALADGGFVVVWHTLDATQDGSSGAVKAQMYDASGARVGGEFLVNSHVKDSQREPMVTALPDGGFVVVWSTFDPLQDGSGMALKGQYFDPSGKPVGGEFLVNSLTSGSQFLPSVAALADGTVLVAWTSESGDGSGYAVRARLFDMAHSPEIVSNGGGDTASVSVSEGEAGVTSVTATDADSATVTYSITGGADAALFTIDAVTGALNFVSAPDHESPADANGDNVYDVVVTASDGEHTDSQSISVTVSNVNEAPVLAGGTTLSLTHAENAAAVTTISATDVDGPSITYAITGGNDAGLFTIDANTGALSFVSSPDFEAPADFGEDNFYTLTVSASDGTNSVEQRIEILVTNENESVTITSDGGGDSASLGVSENSQAVTTVSATDLDGDAVSYAIVGGADADRFTIDSATGAIAFVATPNFEAASDSDQDNVYEVVVEASDGSLNDRQTLNISVTDVNEAPEITSGGTATAAENSTSVSVVTANDPEGQPLIYSISGGVDAGRFTIDSTTGALSFITAPDHEAPADSDGDNIYDVVVGVSDGVHTDTQALAVTVTNAVDGVTLVGTNGANTLTGTVAEDTLRGGGGSDTLNGAAGADVLDGGNGNDTLVGGLGADTLIGGAGADRFTFMSISDSQAGSADVISDFSHGDRDRISVTGIDADANAAGDQAFAFIGAGAFTGTAGELRYEQSDGNTRVMGDVNGDGVADFMIQVTGVVNFGSGDFML